MLAEKTTKVSNPCKNEDQGHLRNHMVLITTVVVNEYMQVSEQSM